MGNILKMDNPLYQARIRNKKKREYIYTIINIIGRKLEEDEGMFTQADILYYIFKRFAENEEGMMTTNEDGTKTINKYYMNNKTLTEWTQDIYGANEYPLRFECALNNTKKMMEHENDYDTLKKLKGITDDNETIDYMKEYNNMILRNHNKIIFYNNPLSNNFFDIEIVDINKEVDE